MLSSFVDLVVQRVVQRIHNKSKYQWSLGFAVGPARHTAVSRTAFVCSPVSLVCKSLSIYLDLSSSPPACRLLPTRVNRSIVRDWKRIQSRTSSISAGQILHFAESLIAYTSNPTNSALVLDILPSPPPNPASEHYNLRPTSWHNRQLPTRSGHLTDANLVTRLLHKDRY